MCFSSLGVPFWFFLYFMYFFSNHDHVFSYTLEQIECFCNRCFISCIMRSLCSGLGEHALFSTMCGLWEVLIFSIPVFLLHVFGSSVPYMHRLVISRSPKGPLCRTPVLFLCTSLFPCWPSWLLFSLLSISEIMVLFEFLLPDAV